MLRSSSFINCDASICILFLFHFRGSSWYCDHTFPIPSFMWQLKQILRLKTDHCWCLINCSLLDVKVLLNHLRLDILEWLGQLFFSFLLSLTIKSRLGFGSSFARSNRSVIILLRATASVSFLLFNSVFLCTICDLSHARQLMVVKILSQWNIILAFSHHETV